MVRLIRCEQNCIMNEFGSWNYGGFEFSVLKLNSIGTGLGQQNWYIFDGIWVFRVLKNETLL